MALLSAGALLSSCGADHEALSAEARPRPHVCEYGMTVFFGLGGDSERLRAGGWSGTEHFLTWSDSPKAALNMRLPSKRDDVHLAFRMGALVSVPEYPFQTVEVYANGEKLATWKVGDVKTFSLVVPARLLRDAPALRVKPTFVPQPGALLTVEFHMLTPISPKELWPASEDPRLLGIQMHELQVTRADEQPATPDELHADKGPDVR